MATTETPRDSLTPILLPDGASTCAKALLLGERIDLRAIKSPTRLAALPLSVPVGKCGVAVLFRYGAAVLINATAKEEQEFLAGLAPLVGQTYERPECETVELRVEPGAEEGIDETGVVLREASIDRLQVVAVVLSRSVALAQYETQIAESFDRIEPLAAELERTGREGHNARELLKHIGGALLIEHKMVARVEAHEKPELLWEHPALEPLYQRLAHEFELRERHLALERKIDLVSDTVRTALQLLQNRRSLRVEWYIVLLIVLEILLTLYGMFLAGRTG